MKEKTELTKDKKTTLLPSLRYVAAKTESVCLINERVVFIYLFFSQLLSLQKIHDIVSRSYISLFILHTQLTGK